MCRVKRREEEGEHQEKLTASTIRQQKLLGGSEQRKNLRNPGKVLYPQQREVTHWLAHERKGKGEAGRTEVLRLLLLSRSFL